MAFELLPSLNKFQPGQNQRHEQDLKAFPLTSRRTRRLPVQILIRKFVLGSKQIGYTFEQAADLVRQLTQNVNLTPVQRKLVRQTPVETVSHWVFFVRPVYRWSKDPDNTIFRYQQVPGFPNVRIKLLIYRKKE